MNILVCGGAGFIGSNFIYDLLAEGAGCNVFCFDALTYAANPGTLDRAKKHSNFRFFKGDISDKELVFSLFEEFSFDAVVNFAAESHVDRSIKTPDVFIKTNVLGTQTLLEACRTFGSIRFHQISTDEVYGSSASGSLCTEKSVLNPSSPYSASKASADLVALAYFKTYSLPVTISRSCNNFGPFQHPEKLIPLTITNALQNKPIPIYGDGSFCRSWLFVKDHVKAIRRVLSGGRPGEIYNVCSLFKKQNLETVRQILSLLNKPETLISFVADRAAHDPAYSISCDKLERELGWSVETEFERGMKETVDWYLDNPLWLSQFNSASE